MDKNLREFKSSLQENVWRMSIEYFPPEYSTSQIEDRELVQSCYELYHYVVDGLDDFIYHPEEYPYIPAELLPYSHILKFHQNILERFLEQAVVKEKNFILINNIDYDNMLQSVKRKINKARIFTKDFTINHLMKSLERKGIVIERDTNQTVVKNEKYPHMFYAADQLEQTATNYYNRTKRTPQQFSLLDFMSIGNDKRKITLEDIIAPLYDNERAYVLKLVDELKQKIRLNCSCKIWYYRTANFRYKAKPLFYIWWGKSYTFELGITLPSPDTTAYHYLESEINKLPNREEFKEFCVRNIKTCKFCNRECMKRNAYKKDWVLFDRPIGKLIRTCEPHITTYSFNEESYNYFRQLIDIYIRMIDLQLI